MVRYAGYLFGIALYCDFVIFVIDWATCLHKGASSEVSITSGWKQEIVQTDDQDFALQIPAIQLHCKSCNTSHAQDIRWS